MAAVTALPTPTTTPKPTTPSASGLVKPLSTAPKPVVSVPKVTTPKPPVPPTIKQAAAQAPKPVTPVYSGPHIAPIAQVASQIGAKYQYNPQTNTHTVNGVQVKPTSVVNGVAHAPVAAVAHAAQVPAHAVQTTSKQVAVKAPAPPPTPPIAAPGTTVPGYRGTYLTTAGGHEIFKEQGQGGYYANVYDPNGKLIATYFHGNPQGGHEGTLMGFGQSVGAAPGNAVYQEKVNGGYYNNVYNPQGKLVATYYHPNPAPQPQQPNPSQDLSQLQQPYLDQIMNSAPQAPQLPQLPTFDPNQVLSQFQQIQPFQWDANQDFMNQYNAQLPAFQQQLTSEDQKINDEMNKRGLYNSGIAQQNVDMQNQALYGKLFDSIQKQALADQKQAYTEWQGQANLTQKNNQYLGDYALNSYKANLDAAYKNGQLTDQQYADAINEWSKQVSALQAAMQEQASLNQAQLPYTMGPTPAQMLPYEYPSANTMVPYMYGPTPAQMLPYQYPTANTLVPYIYGPTPYQQQTLSLDQLKTILPYQQMTAYQQATIGLDQQKLQAQIAQDAVADQQKWAQIMGVGPNGQPTLDAQKLQEQIVKDSQAAQVAAANASNNQVRTQLSALHDQLVAAGQMIANLNNNPTQANKVDPATGKTYLQEAIQNYNTINAEIAAIGNGAGGYSPK